jgi:hypothetical protein
MTDGAATIQRCAPVAISVRHSDTVWACGASSLSKARRTSRQGVVTGTMTTPRGRLTKKVPYMASRCLPPESRLIETRQASENP